MKKDNLFYLIIIFTIFVIRLVNFLYPKHLVIYGILIHHFWTGVLLILITILFFRNNNLRLIFMGIGLGFIIDELGFMILGGGDFPQYWALYSILSIVFLLIIIHIFRKKIYKAIFK